MWMGPLGPGNCGGAVGASSCCWSPRIPELFLMGARGAGGAGGPAGKAAGMMLGLTSLGAAYLSRPGMLLSALGTSAGGRGGSADAILAKAISPAAGVGCAAGGPVLGVSPLQSRTRWRVRSAF